MVVINYYHNHALYVSLEHVDYYESKRVGCFHRTKLICQKIKSENLNSPIVAVLFKTDFKVGYPQISL